MNHHNTSKRRIHSVIAMALLALSNLSCTMLAGPEPDNNPVALFEELWGNFKETYALFAVKGIDWDEVYQEYRPQIVPGMSDIDLFAVCADMLAVLDDQHVNLMAPFAFSNSGGRLNNNEAFSLELIRSSYLVEAHSAGSGMFTWGRIASQSDTGYIHVAGFAFGNTGLDQTQDWAADIDTILAALADCNSIIVDNRGNRGGLTGNVMTVSSRFAAEERVYAISRTKNGPGENDYSLPVELKIRPDGPIRYTKPVYFLTNGETISAGEYFTLAMTSQSHVTHVGSGTAGAFSLSLERFLVNGWRFTVSVQRVSNAAGLVLENLGVIPAAEHRVENSLEGLAAGEDYQLDHALSLAAQ